MSYQAITLMLPNQLYQQLADKAAISRQSVDEVIIQTIRAGMPPGLDNVPERFRADDK